MNGLKAGILIVIVALLGWGMYVLIQERNELGSEVEKLSASANFLREENESLEEKIEYYKNSENLLKELKSQFNYREEGEKLIIIVPETQKSTSTEE